MLVNQLLRWINLTKWSKSNSCHCMNFNFENPRLLEYRQQTIGLIKKIFKTLINIKETSFNLKI